MNEDELMVLVIRWLEALKEQSKPPQSPLWLVTLGGMLGALEAWDKTNKIEPTAQIKRPWQNEVCYALWDEILTDDTVAFLRSAASFDRQVGGQITRFLEAMAVYFPKRAQQVRRIKRLLPMATTYTSPMGWHQVPRTHCGQEAEQDKISLENFNTLLEPPRAVSSPKAIPDFTQPPSINDGLVIEAFDRAWAYLRLAKSSFEPWLPVLMEASRRTEDAHARVELCGRAFALCQAQTDASAILSDGEDTEEGIARWFDAAWTNNKTPWRAYLVLHTLHKSVVNQRDLVSIGRLLRHGLMVLADGMAYLPDVMLGKAPGAHQDLLNYPYEELLFRARRTLYPSTLWQEGGGLEEKVSDVAESVLARQLTFSEQVKALLAQLWRESGELLGSPVCETALLLLGSTALAERGPYSDVELALVHSEPRTPDDAEQFQAYLHTRLRLFDLLVVRLNETPCGAHRREGIRIDVSTTGGRGTGLIHTRLMPAGSVESLIADKVQSALNAAEGFEHGQSYFSLLQGVLINEGESGAADLYKTLMTRLSRLVDVSLSQSQQRRLYQRPLRGKDARLTYRQASGAFCYQAVLGEAIGQWNRAQSDEATQQPGYETGVSLKTLCYKPVYYLTRWLSLWNTAAIGYSIDTSAPMAVLQKAYEQNQLSLSFFRLWGATLEWVGTLRQRLDMNAGKQEDRAYRPCEVSAQQPGHAYLTPDEWAGLGLLMEGVFKPLHELMERMVEQGVLCAPEKLLLPMAFMAPYLRARNALLIDFPHHPLVRVLWHHPDSLGNSPEALTTQASWDRQCQTLLAQPDQPTRYWVEGGPWASQQPLSPDLGAQLFDAAGKPRPEEPYSSARSAVRCLRENGTQTPIAFIKIDLTAEPNPSLIAQQYAIWLLHQHLGIRAIAPGYPLRITVTPEDGRSPSKSYWAWVSQAVGGRNVKDWVETEPKAFEAAIPRFSKLNIAEQFVFALVTGQEDGSLRNFIHGLASNPVADPDGWLWCVDSGQAFVRGTREGALFEAKGLMGKEYIVLKSLIMLLAQPMGEPMDRAMAERLMSLEPAAVMVAWQAQIGEVNRRYGQLLRASAIAAGFKEPPPFIELSETNYRMVKITLDDLKRWVTTNYPKLLTLDRLLISFDRTLAHRYQTMRPKRWRDFDFTQLEPPAYVSPARGVNRPNGASSRSYQDVKRLQRDDTKKHRVFDDAYFRDIDFGKMRTAQGEIDVPSQRVFLKMMEGVPFTQLNLSGCTKLTEERLAQLIEQSPGLTHLDLTNCSQLRDFNKVVRALFPLIRGLFFASPGEQLEQLCLAGTSFPLDAVFERLPHLQRLQKLAVSDKEKSIALSWNGPVSKAQASEARSILRRNKAQFKRRGDDDLTALHRAVIGGGGIVISALLAIGMDIDVKDDNQNTPLHLAAFNGQTQMVSLLLAHGANINASQENGYAPLHWAFAMSRVDVITVLTDAGASIEMPQINQRIPLTTAQVRACLGQARIPERVIDTLIQTDLSLLSNPFALLLSVRTLPRLIRERVNINCHGVYEAVLQDWFAHRHPAMSAHVASLSLGAVMAQFDAFAQELALGMCTTGQETMNLVGSEQWQAFFTAPAPSQRQAWVGCPLHYRPIQGYRFTHPSYQDYFIAKSLLLALRAPVIVMPEVWRARNLAMRSMIVEFIAAGIKTLSPEERQVCMDCLDRLLEQAKGNPAVQFSGANALTLWVVLGRSCSGKDLQRLHAPGANLNRGNFDHANLQGACLEGAVAHNAILRNTNLREANLRGVDFGQDSEIKADGGINAIACSPDGLAMAVGLYNGTIQLMGVDTGKVLKQLTGHTNWVKTVSYSPDGQQVASGSGDKTMRLWSVATGECEQVLEGHTRLVNAVSYRPDGQQLASGGYDKTVRLWSVAGGQCERVLEAHTDPVSAVSYNPDGQQVASGSWDNTVRLWSVAGGQCERVLKGHRNWVNAVSYRPDGQQLASGSDDKTVRLWSVATGEYERVLKGHTGWVRAVSYSPDGQQLASGSEDNTARLWSVASGECLQVLRLHQDYVNSVVFAPDGRLFTGSEDGSIALWAPLSAELNAPWELVWTNPPCLLLEGAQLAVATGLSAGNRRVLIKGGAMNVPEPDEARRAPSQVLNAPAQTPFFQPATSPRAAAVATQSTEQHSPQSVVVTAIPPVTAGSNEALSEVAKQKTYNPMQ